MRITYKKIFFNPFEYVIPNLCNPEVRYLPRPDASKTAMTEDKVTKVHYFGLGRRWIDGGRDS